MAGIIFVNIPAVLEIGVSLPLPTARIWLDTFVQGRFFPIFSLLFGIGFGMLWLIAPGRTARPRVALLHRLLFLGLLGALHQLLQPGEALLPYALVGLVLLLPATFLPQKPWARWLLIVVGAALLFVGTWEGGEIYQIPGLLLLGFVAGLQKVTATLLMILIKYVVPTSFWEEGSDQAWLVAMIACVGILVVQLIWSQLWLRRFGQGPLERLWRIVTWWKK